MGRALIAAVIAITALPAIGRAGDGDGAYRRWDHNTFVVMGVGGGTVHRGGELGGTLAASVRVRIADAAGPFAAFRWSPTLGNHLLLGAELRPLWPALFLLDLSTGHEWLDLTLQSIGVELGVALLPLDQSLGAGFGMGFGIELPLNLPSATGGHFHGVALRLAARRVWSSARFQGAHPDDLSEWSVLASLLIRIGTGLKPSTWEPARYVPN